MWEWFNTVAGAVSLMSLILGGILGLVTWRITQATDKLIIQSHTDTRALIRDVHAETQRTLDRMDQRADERQRQMTEAIQALRR